MKRKLLTIVMAAVMVIATAAPASYSFAGTTNGTVAPDEQAVLDGKTVKTLTEQELDKQSVMGHDVDENTESLGDDSFSLLSLTRAWAKKSTGVWYDGNGKNTLTGAKAKGIDVSYWQGTINWQKVKNDGIDFAIIRLGWGSDYSSQDDKKLTYNVQQCEKYGIPYGFYLYSYANTAAKNESEIRHVLRLLKGTHPTYPVYYDIEDSGTNGKVSQATLRNYAVNFCNKVKAAGYTPGVYASLSWWKGKLHTSALDPFERWVAQWNNTGCTYSRSWKLWQCADNYKVSGISGRVDLNFAYKKFTASNTSGSTNTSSSTSTSASSGDTSTSTSASSSSSSTSATKTTGWVTKNGNRYYYDSSGNMIKSKWFTISGKKYYATSSGAVYKSTYKKIGNYYYGFDSKGAMYAGKTVKIGGKKYYFTKKTGKARLVKTKTKARLNKRTGPGTKYESKGLYKKGATVNIIRKSGDWWQTTQGVWVNKKYLKVKKTYPY